VRRMNPLDPYTHICQLCYTLLKLIVRDYRTNELYTAQWINLFFHHATQTPEDNVLGVEETLMAMVTENKKLLEIQITPEIIQVFIDLSKK